MQMQNKDLLTEQPEPVDAAERNGESGNGEEPGRLQNRDDQLIREARQRVGDRHQLLRNAPDVRHLFFCLSFCSSFFSFESQTLTFAERDFFVPFSFSLHANTQVSVLIFLFKTFVLKKSRPLILFLRRNLLHIWHALNARNACGSSSENENLIWWTKTAVASLQH